MRFILLITAILLCSALPARAEMIDYPNVKIQALDKSTARTITLEAKVGTTIEYGSIFIKIQSCRKSEPLDKPESAAFLQIWEVPVNSDKSQWVFSGWMFASSPALSAMDHSVYDVWVLDCTDPDKKVQVNEPAIEEEEITPAVVQTEDSNSLENIIEEAVQPEVEETIDTPVEQAEPSVEEKSEDDSSNYD